MAAAGPSCGVDAGRIDLHPSECSKHQDDSSLAWRERSQSKTRTRGESRRLGRRWNLQEQGARRALRQNAKSNKTGEIF